MNRAVRSTHNMPVCIGSRVTNFRAHERLRLIIAEALKIDYKTLGVEFICDVY